METIEHAGLVVATTPDSKERVDHYDCGSRGKRRLVDEEEKNDGPAQGKMKKFRSIAYIYKITRPVDA